MATTSRAERSEALDVVSRIKRPVGQALRRVRCDNGLVSRYGFNLVPSIKYRREPPELGEASQKVAADLLLDGVTVADSRALLGADASLFDRIQARVRDLQAEKADQIAERRAALARGETNVRGKGYLVEMLGSRPEVDPADPLIEFAMHSQIMGIAERYYECKVRLHEVNVWQNLASAAPPSKSQKWHRDLLEDVNIVKAFLYIDDVPEGAGPLAYIKSTNTPAGRDIKLPSTWDGIGFRVEDELIDARFDQPEIVRATGQAGDVAWADTMGLHRGGHAQTVDRLVVMYTFCTGACCRRKTLVSAPGVSKPARTHLSVSR